MRTALQADPLQRLLVTGASGFVGGHVVAAVLRDRPGLQVVACDLRRGERMPAGCHFLALDVRDPTACDRVLREARPTHVLHAAAMTDGPEDEVLAVNAQGAKNVFRAAAAVASTERCLLLSSSAVYGAGRGTAACDEDRSLRLESAYARSKRLAELFACELEQATGLPILAARLGPCYGAAEVVGPFRPRLSLVGRLMEAHRRGLCLRVAGEDYARDWTDLDQVTEALLALLACPAVRHRIYNVSAGQAIGAREVIAAFGALGLRVDWTDAAAADVVLRADDGRAPLAIERLRDDTGFEPRLDWRRRMASMLAEGAVTPPPAT